MRISSVLVVLFAIPMLQCVHAADTPPLSDPTIILIRDDAVCAELACTSEQKKSLDELLRKHNRMLLAIRDVSPSGADETAKSELAEIRDELAKLFTDDQKLRLQGLTLQAQGYNALLRKDIVDAIKLTEGQQTHLKEISARFHEQAKETEVDLAKLQATRHKEVVAVLTSDQQNQYGTLLGQPFDFTKVIKSPAWAPEFVGIEEWISSEPHKMSDLKGKVVVVHFFAFGCSNCINNYPWYREWHDAFAGQDVVLVGIHTPETQAEADNNLLRQSLERYQLKFPVAVDKEKKMWQAWYNGIWPSVYIIDRKGRVRYWWYGELDWQGAGNQKVARRQIEELLAEAQKQ